MNQRTYRGRCYVALAHELETWRGLAVDELIARVGVMHAVVVQIEGEDIFLDVQANWFTEKRDSIRVFAVASGTSHWQIERLEESIVIKLQRTTRLVYPNNAT